MGFKARQPHYCKTDVSGCCGQIKEEMILSRIGNKTQIADEIQKYFPEHRNYVEMFFGAGGMFFNKPLLMNYK